MLCKPEVHSDAQNKCWDKFWLMNSRSWQRCRNCQAWPRRWEMAMAVAAEYLTIAKQTPVNNDPHKTRIISSHRPIRNNYYWIKYSFCLQKAYLPQSNKVRKILLSFLKVSHDKCKSLLNNKCPSWFFMRIWSRRILSQGLSLLWGCQTKKNSKHLAFGYILFWDGVCSLKRLFEADASS